MLKSMLLVVVGTCVLFGQALACGALPCWNTVTPQNVVGFDFEITSVVQGPDKSGLYTYTYTIYRLDQGFVCYNRVSHISFWFPCGPAAERGVLNGVPGITVSCRWGDCSAIEMGKTNGMSEATMSPACRLFWGFRLDQCGDDDFLLPNFNGVSYPQDRGDPYCTITFRSRSAPEWGKWFVKGGCEKSRLYDAGDIKVPTCIPAVDVGNMTWGAIKVIYR
jgi:hypothetical protein